MLPIIYQYHTELMYIAAIATGLLLWAVNYVI